MNKLPRGLSSREMVRALQRDGFYIRRRKGSHIIMRRDSPFAQTVVPAHKSIDTGTLDKILEGADLTVERLLELLTRLLQKWGGPPSFLRKQESRN